MLWLVFNLLLIITVYGQGCTEVGVVSAILEPTATQFSFTVKIDAEDDLKHVHFLHANNPEMNLVGPVESGMTWWNCAEDIYPESIHTILGVQGCVQVANGCSTSSFATVQWWQVQEGRMFWFLLEPTSDPNRYSLSTDIEVKYLDTSASKDVIIRDKYVSELLKTELDELGIAPPTMDIRVTEYEIGAVNSQNQALIRLEMELHLSDEVTWDLLSSEPPTLESEETAFNVNEAVITKVGNDVRTWQAVLSVSVCDLSGPRTLTVTKPVLDQAVQFTVSSTLEIDMQSACPQNNPIGDLPTESSSTVYSDASYTTENRDFYLGDTVYACTTLSSNYATLASAAFDSLSITQSTTTTDLTSQTTQLSTSVVSTGTVQTCISFTLPETLTAVPVGTPSQVSTTYSLTYTDPSTGRRLLSTDFLSSDFKINIRSSDCTYPDGKVARLGDLRTLPCQSGYGVETRKCHNHRWEMVEECSLSYLSHFSRLQSGLCVFSVLAACYFSSGFFSNFKVGKD